ncbi:hypothetical protein [Pontibacillus yanchengensis]|uniref:Uncharacterized protein n=1 Tax=Pontibacillus yanchengensis Y32 TaxID=1385514 RepID=A0A0A2TP93_9BACI|nr:hypothetical protein [Pontibacillus yanchengensis]KGP71165.1 hypothetical protein N782_19490 [Pontibacillus yanchengensis Y32]
MKHFFKKRLYWLVPFLIVLASISLVFFQRIEAISKEPETDWSRKVEVGKTTINRAPYVHKNENEYIITQFIDGSLSKTEWDPQFNELDKQTIEVPFGKWDSFFYQDDFLAYFNGEEIIDKQKNVVANAETFYPTASAIFYTYDQQLHRYNPEAKETSTLLDVPDGYSLIPIKQSATDNPPIYFKRTKGNKVEVIVYQHNGDGYKQVATKSSEFPPSQQVEDVIVSTTNEKIGLFVLASVSTGNKKTLYPYIAEAKLNGSDMEFKETKLNDPHAGGTLREPSEFSATYRNNTFHVLFKASGKTDRSNVSNRSFNVYELAYQDGDTQVERRSHSYRLIFHPTYIDNQTIIWNEIGEPYKLFIASSNPKIVNKANSYTFDDALIAFGDTMSMLFKGLVTVVLTAHWFIWPLAFFAALFLFFRRFTDEDPYWVFYAGVGIYLASALLLKSHFFIPSFNSTAPAYFSFTGSSYFYIIFFALLAYLCVKLTSDEWSSVLKAAYFIGVHILFMICILGPYVIFF